MKRIGAFEWQRALRRSAELTAAEHHIALCLSTYMGKDGGSCYPSYKSLARDAHRKRATVIRAIASLEMNGWLTVRRGGGRGHPNHYFATAPEWALDAPTAGPETKGAQTDTVSREKRMPDGPQTVPRGSGKGHDGEPLPPNTSQIPLRLTAAEMQDRYPDLWRAANETTLRATNVRNHEAYQLQVAHEALDREREQQRALDYIERHQQAIDDCGDCASNGLIEGPGGMWRCNHDGSRQALRPQGIRETHGRA